MQDLIDTVSIILSCGFGYFGEGKVRELSDLGAIFIKFMKTIYKQFQKSFSYRL